MSAENEKIAATEYRECRSRADRRQHRLQCGVPRCDDEQHEEQQSEVVPQAERQPVHAAAAWRRSAHAVIRHAPAMIAAPTTTSIRTPSSNSHQPSSAAQPSAVYSSDNDLLAWRRHRRARQGGHAAGAARAHRAERRSAQARQRRGGERERRGDQRREQCREEADVNASSVSARCRSSTTDTA